jgi:hypothetical protein
MNPIVSPLSGAVVTNSMSTSAMRPFCVWPWVHRFGQTKTGFGVKHAAHPEYCLGSSLGTAHCAQTPIV